MYLHDEEKTVKLNKYLLFRHIILYIYIHSIQKPIHHQALEIESAMLQTHSSPSEVTYI